MCFPLKLLIGMGEAEDSWLPCLQFVFHELGFCGSRELASKVAYVFCKELSWGGSYHYVKGKGLVFTDLQGDRHLKCGRVFTSAVGLRVFFFEGAENLTLLVNNPSCFWLAASQHLTEPASVCFRWTLRHPHGTLLKFKRGADSPEVRVSSPGLASPGSWAWSLVSM